MKKNSLVTLIACALAGFGVEVALAAGTYHIETTDTSPAIRFNVPEGHTSVVTVVSGGRYMYNTLDGHSNAVIDMANANYDTIAEVAAWLAGTTNAAGVSPVVVDSGPSLAADSANATLLAGAYTASTAGVYTEILWDTSACGFFSVYLQTTQPVILTELFGDVGGYGDAVFSAYIDGTLAWQKRVATNTTVPLVVAPPEINLPVRNGRKVNVRVTRTATTSGSFGVVAESD